MLILHNLKSAEIDEEYTAVERSCLLIEVRDQEGGGGAEDISGSSEDTTKIQTTTSKTQIEEPRTLVTVSKGSKKAS